MGRLLLIVTLLLVSYQQADAQYDNIWAFGRYAGFDFSTSPPTPIKTSMNTREGCASICDENGQLLFYTDGASVWDRNNQEMPNGHNITGLAMPYSYTSSTSQGAVIIPAPGHPGQYYIFSLTCLECAISGRLNYSIVDMQLNNGLGDIVPGKKGIVLKNKMAGVLKYNLTEHMTAVSGDNCDAWLITLSSVQNTFYVYNITYEGIDTIAVSSPGLPSKHLTQGYEKNGCVDIAPNRKKLAIALDRLVLYDFDPATGKIENPVVLNQGSGAYYGVCFSPDNSKLYATQPEASHPSFMQFDVSSGDSMTMVNSKVLLSQDTLRTYSLRRAPDGKMYAARYDGKADTGWVTVIRQPNLKGLACQFDPTPIRLFPGTQAVIGLPNVAVIQKNAHVYTAPTSGADSFCSYETVVLHPRDTTGINYVWNNTIRGKTLKVDSSGTYWVSYQLISDVCTEVTDTFLVYFKHLSTKLNIRPECHGAKDGSAYHVRDSGDHNHYGYQWRSAHDTVILSTDSFLYHVAAGDYVVHIRSSNGCDTTMNFHIPEADYRVSFEPDTLICSGDIVPFRNHSDARFDQWKWDFGDGDTSVLKAPAHSFRGHGVYKVMLIGKDSMCTDTAYRTVEVDAPAQNLRFVTDRKEICKGETIHFSVSSDAPYVGLSWQFGDGTSASSGIEDKRQHAYDSSGYLPVRLTAHFRACPDISYTDTVKVYPLPYVDLGRDTAICLQGAPVILTNLAENRPGTYHYLWNTGDTSKEIQVRHPGEYSLKVSTEPLGCYTKETVKVTKDCYIDIPNAFTPNGDGNNDYFLPRDLLSKGVTGFEMSIYNRWGEKIFVTNKTDGRGWDGRFNGVPQPQGVYVYTIDVRYKNNRTEHYQGNVTLIR